MLHWSTDAAHAIAVDTTLSGFGYTASFSGAKAPYAVVNVNGGFSYGDPFIPASPNALQAGLIPATPEPETYAMMMAGLGFIGAIARRRKA